MASNIAKVRRTNDIVKYGLHWLPEATPLDIEMEMIRRGGQYEHTFPDKKVATVGKGLLHHYLAMRKLVWPDRYEHAWTRLIYKEIINNSMTTLMGSASSQKTSHMSEWALLDYWCFPDNTLVLATTISVDKLKAGIWAEIAKLWSQGKQRFPELAGVLIEYLRTITTEQLDPDNEFAVRDLRKGIMGRSLYANRTFQGIGHYAGIKQERFRWLADESSHCPSTLLDCLPNLRSNTRAGGLKLILSGNPRGDADDQLGVAAEPRDGGWITVGDVEKTTCWDTTFYGGRCVNLVGIDSPNFHESPVGGPDKYEGLIGRKYAEIIEHDYGRNSPEWENQVMGRMRLGMALKRVVTRQSCRDHGAMDEVIWLGTQRTRVYGLDPAYGGGDRCVGILAEFGKDKDGTLVIMFHKPYIFKITARDEDPETQIANILYSQLAEYNVPNENCFYDSFGKGTLGFAFGHKFGYNPPIPVDTSGRPSGRPVRSDLFIFDRLKKTNMLKPCDQHYSKFVSELWFSMRYAIESGQVRGLGDELVKELSARQYDEVGAGKLEVESKIVLKERTGKSPDLADAATIALEGARQRGFTIGALSNDNFSEAYQWLDDIRQEQNNLRKGWALNYSA